MQLRLGVDIACRAPHQTSLADDKGSFLWSGRRFRTSPEDLEALWASLPEHTEVIVVMEPTRNAWVPLAAWFRRKGARDGDLARMSALHFCAAGYTDPYLCRRIGRARLARFFHRHSHGRFSGDRAAAVLAAAHNTLSLWNHELDYGELADDIAVEARLALALTEEIKELEQRIAVMLHALDPSGIMQSVPGVGAVGAAQILGRLGDPTRFRSLAGARSFSGLVPSLNASGTNGRHGGPTKSGDALLREAHFMSANAARRIDPTLAQRYHRLMTVAGKHHNSALCHLSTVLLTRIVSCWKSQEPYVLRDTDGTVITPDEGRRIIAARYTVSAELREQRRTTKNGRSPTPLPAGSPVLNGGGRGR